MRKVSILFLLFAVCFTGQPIQSQVASKKFNVTVNVRCKDETTKILIESYIKRELRNLEDALVDSQNSLVTHSLYLIAIEQQYITGVKNGQIEIASTYCESFYPYDAIINSNLSHEEGIQATGLIAKAGFPLFLDIYRQGFLSTGATKDLPILCRNIVAAFDTTVLEKIRGKR